MVNDRKFLKHFKIPNEDSLIFSDDSIIISQQLATKNGISLTDLNFRHYFISFFGIRIDSCPFLLQQRVPLQKNGASIRYSKKNWRDS